MTGEEYPLLILLVGSNPLPNYLTTCALQPRRVALVYTEETKDARDRLKAELKRALGENVGIVEPFVEDATCATTVQRAIDPWLSRSEVWLNYTGGTKVMAAHARMTYSKSGGKPEHASYLDEGGKDSQPRLRFDNGTLKPLSEYSDVPLDLRTILALHGITHQPREPKAPAPTVEDAREILCKVLQDVHLAADLYGERERLEDKKYSNPNNAVSVAFRADRYGMTLSLATFPTEEQLNSLATRRERESWFKQWYKFIGGEWLEEWLGAQIRTLDLKPAPEITVGVNAKRGSKEVDLEVDVAVVRGHRSYFISCTTDTTKALCKSKLFEIAVRSQQLGGDLARAALVCLADDRTVSALQADIDDVWGASNTSRVFGLSDIRTWSDCGDKQPNLHALKTWLES
jgi:hypothetical protein